MVISQCSARVRIVYSDMGRKTSYGLVHVINTNRLVHVGVESPRYPNLPCQLATDRKHKADHHAFACLYGFIYEAVDTEMTLEIDNPSLKNGI